MPRLTPAVSRSPSGSPSYSATGLVGWKGDGLSWRASLLASVAIFGDSRTQLGRAGYQSATFADSKGLDIAPSFCGQGITAAGTGTLEFRASDGYLRWTAPGDSAGPWTAGYAGRNILQSGTADKTLDLGVRSYSANPATDQTISVTVSGTYQRGYWSSGFWVWALHALRWPTDDVQPVGVGGSVTDDVIEQLPYLETVAGGPGVDIILVGTNDITAGAAVATVTANLRTIYDTRRALGRRLILVNEPARWNGSIGTPMTAQQQADHEDINDFIRAYAATNGCLHVDAYTATVDTDFSDRRPKSGYLVDEVHFADTGAYVVGQLIADVVSPSTGLGPFRLTGDTSNLLSIGDFAGTGGTNGTGSSGTVATGWTVNRLTTDATIVSSVEDRGPAGQWQVIEWTATTSGNVQAFTTSNQTLAALGLSAGDEIYGEMQVAAEDLVNVYNLRCYIVCNGTTPALSVYSSLSGGTTATLVDGEFLLRTPVFKVPSDMTSLTIRTQAQIKANSSGRIKVGSAAIVRA